MLSCNVHSKSVSTSNLEFVSLLHSLNDLKKIERSLNLTWSLTSRAYHWKKAMSWKLGILSLELFPIDKYPLTLSRNCYLSSSTLGETSSCTLKLSLPLLQQPTHVTIHVISKSSCIYLRWATKYNRKIIMNHFGTPPKILTCEIHTIYVRICQSQEQTQDDLLITKIYEQA